MASCKYAHSIKCGLFSFYLRTPLNGGKILKCRKFWLYLTEWWERKQIETIFFLIFSSQSEDMENIEWVNSDCFELLSPDINFGSCRVALLAKY